MTDATILTPSRLAAVRGHVRGNPLLLVGGIMAVAIVFIALFARKLYGATLHDPNGVRPLPVHIGGKLFEVDMNAALVIVGSVVLVVAVFIF